MGAACTPLWPGQLRNSAGTTGGSGSPAELGASCTVCWRFLVADPWGRRAAGGVGVDSNALAPPDASVLPPIPPGCLPLLWRPLPSATVGSCHVIGRHSSAKGLSAASNAATHALPAGKRCPFMLCGDLHLNKRAPVPREAREPQTHTGVHLFVACCTVPWVCLMRELLRCPNVLSRPSRAIQCTFRTSGEGAVGRAARKARRGNFASFSRRRALPSSPAWRASVVKQVPGRCLLTALLWPRFLCAGAGKAAARGDPAPQDPKP